MQRLFYFPKEKYFVTAARNRWQSIVLKCIFSTWRMIGGVSVYLEFGQTVLEMCEMYLDSFYEFEFHENKF